VIEALMREWEAGDGAQLAQAALAGLGGAGQDRSPVADESMTERARSIVAGVLG
jgi:hypothetical protein